MSALVDGFTTTLQGGVNMPIGVFNVGIRIRSDGTTSGEASYLFFSGRGSYNAVTGEWSGVFGAGRSFGSYDSAGGRTGFFAGVGFDQQGLFAQATGTINFPLGGSPSTPYFSGVRFDEKYPIASYDEIQKFLIPLQNFLRDPLILDLDGDGIEVSGISGSTIHFDFAGDGFAELTGWVSADDGILAIDDNRNGRIDNGLELFGSSTQDGFSVLEKFDTDGNGIIDSQDADFAQLRIWQDTNQNGISDAGELRALSDVGVASISLNRHDIVGTNLGNEIGYQAAYALANGGAGIAQTIYFQTNGQQSVADNTPGFTIADGVDKLPQLQGAGLINSIAYKASIDAGFREDWTELTDNAATMSISDLRSDFQALLLRWAGIDAVHPTSRGYFVDARHLAFVEKFFGDTYREIQLGNELREYPSTAALGDNVERSFEQISNLLELIFLTQVTTSITAREGDFDLLLSNPYFAYSFLDIIPRGVDDPALETPANIGMVAEMIVAMAPPTGGDAVNYVSRAFAGLASVIPIVFGGDRAAFFAAVFPYLAEIPDVTVREIATHIVNGSALLGSGAAEGINGTGGNDLFIGGGGGDVVNGASGSDIYVYGKHDGDLWIKDQGGASSDTDRLVLTDLNSANLRFDRIGDNLLIRVTETGKTLLVESFFNQWGIANHGIDVIRFADGTEWSRTQIKDASVSRGDGDANYISDSGGDDVIYGGGGNDEIHIGSGNDTILYGKGDGYDVIDDSSWSSTESDTFILTDLNASDVELSRVGAHLVLTVKATGEYVQFLSFFPGSVGNWDTHGRSIEIIKFADGTSWDRDQIQQHAWYRGSDRADTIQLSELNDTIEFGKGDDIIEGWSGSDTYIWRVGDGNDQISDFSSPLTNNGDDVDTLNLVGVSMSQVSFSYQGQTLLIGIDSGETITIRDFLGGVPSLLTGNASHEFGIDVIKFADGEMNRQQITFQAGYQYIGWERNTYSSYVAGIIVYSYFLDEFGHGGNIVGNQLTGLQSNNDIWTASSYGGVGGIFGIPNALQPSPFHSGGNNTLIGSGVRDVLGGGLGADSIEGGNGNDLLYGDYPDESVGGGNDIINGGDGDDLIYGGAGMDMLNGGAGNDYIYGGDGKDYIDSYVGDDVIVGGRGDDVFIGYTAYTTGSDTYIYNRGDGNDLIMESSSGDAAYETDALVLSDIFVDDVELSRVGDELLIRLRSTNEMIKVQSHFYRGDDNNVAGAGIELIRFADAEWDRQKIQQAAWLRGTDGRDIIVTDTSNAHLSDTIEGGKGDDVIVSTIPNFGKGDTFIYSSGDGNDTISESNGTWSSIAVEVDTLRFTDLNASEVQLTRSGDDLLVKILTTGEVITVFSQFAGNDLTSASGLELLHFANGEEWGKQRIQHEAWFRGTDGRDLIELESWHSDTVEAGKGDDNIMSNFLQGGSDTFIYARGDGNDYIREEATRSAPNDIDVLVLKDIDSSDVRLSRSGIDLLVKILSTDEVITISQQFIESADAPGVGIEYIRFANGTQWGRETILGIATSSSPFIVGSSGNDVLTGASLTQNIYGEAGNDTIDGRGGSDLLYGGIGDDTFIVGVSAPGDVLSIVGGAGTDTVDLSDFNAAVWFDFVTSGAELRTTDQADLVSGVWRDMAQVESAENIIGTAFDDYIAGDAGDNVLVGGAGADVLDGRSGNDLLIGGLGNDSLTGGMGTDHLEGGEGDDILSGGLGADIIVGGAGNDALTGGDDADLFLFGLGSGNDVITDFASGDATGHDVIRIDRSLFTDFATMMQFVTQVGADVVIAVGDGNTITLENTEISSLTAANFEFRRIDNKAPSSISVQGATVLENAAAGTVVATLTAIDTGDAGIHSFSIVGGHDLFEIVGNNVVVKSGAVVDFEVASQHVLNIKTVDDDGLFVISPVTIAVTDQTEVLTGAPAGSILLGGLGVDVLNSGVGNDRLIGGSGSDQYVYIVGGGDDRIVEAGGAADTDRLSLGTGIVVSDIIVGRSSSNTADIVLRLATGGTILLQDQLSNVAGTGIEEIHFFDGTVWTRADILARLQPNLILGTSGNDVLVGGMTAETFVAGLGNDTLRGREGGDTYEFNAAFGTDKIIESNDEGIDQVKLGSLNAGDVQLSRSGNDLVISAGSSGGSVTVTDHFSWANSGIEQIVFADGTIWDKTQIQAVAYTLGTNGNDTLVGSVDDDVLRGGLGNDMLQGSVGNDTYAYFSGDGNDIIQDVNQSIDTDTIRFNDFNVQDLEFGRAGHDLLIKVLSTGEIIKVIDQFASADDYWGIERVVFADSTVWIRDQIADAVWFRGTSAAETIEGTSTAETIDGGGGNDRLVGRGGNDTYLFGLGSGNDTIFEGIAASDGNGDNVKLVGLDLADVKFSRLGDDLHILIVASGETLKVEGQFNGDGGIEQIVFADGTVWGRNETANAVIIGGSNAAETIVGTSGGDTLRGRGGDDVIDGLSGDDIYIYARGDGNDVITDSAFAGNADRLVLNGINPADVNLIRNSADGIDVTVVIAPSAVGAGDGGSILLKETLDDYYDRGVEQIVFDDGTVWTRADVRVKILDLASTSGNDTITGFNSNDIIHGGAGDDSLNGLSGNDTFVYARGDGSDVITDSAFAGNVDRLVLNGINPADVSLVRNSADGIDVTLMIAPSAVGAGDGGSILLKETLDDYYDRGVEQIVFDDGTVWSRDDVRVKILDLASTSGNDTITGFNSNDTIHGGAGDDSLNGLSGNDTFVYARGDGNDVITDGAFAGNADRLVLNGINPDEVSLVRNSSDGVDVTLMIATSAVGAGDGGSILLKETLDDYYDRGVEQIAFDDGTVWTRADIRVKILDLASTLGNDTIIGFNSNDTIHGGAGDDSLNGLSGNDTFIYARGDGNDVITENWFAGNADRLVLNGIDPNDVSLVRNSADGIDVTLMIAPSAVGAGDGGSVLLKESLDDYYDRGIEQIVFDDATVWTRADLRAKILDLASTSGNDTIIGFNNVNDTLRGGAGDDILTGGGGNDKFVFGAGFGQDRITDFAAGNDLIEFRDGLFADAAGALAAATQSGSDVLITIDASTSILLQNVAMANLHVDDFRVV